MMSVHNPFSATLRPLDAPRLTALRVVNPCLDQDDRGIQKALVDGAMSAKSESGYFQPPGKSVGASSFESIVAIYSMDDECEISVVGEERDKTTEHIPSYSRVMVIAGLASAPPKLNDITFLHHNCWREVFLSLQTKHRNRFQKNHPPPPDPSTVSSLDTEPQIVFHQPPPFSESMDDQDVAQYVVSSGSLSLPLSIREDAPIIQSTLPETLSSDSIGFEDSLTPPPCDDSIFVLEILQHLISYHFIAKSEPDSNEEAVSSPQSPLVSPNPNEQTQDQTIDLYEKFSLALFDEDDKVMLGSLERCRRVCEELDPQVVISDLSEFLDLLVMALHSDDPRISRASSSLLIVLLPKVDLESFTNRFWNPLSSSFLDGNRNEQKILLLTATLLVSSKDMPAYSFTNVLMSFDWKGLETVRLDTALLMRAVEFLVSLFEHRPTNLSRKTASILRQFESKQNALSRISSRIASQSALNDIAPKLVSSELSYSVIMSLDFGRELPQPLFDYVASTDISTHHQLLDIPVSSFLNHTSSNLRVYRQQTFLMELFFERQLRSDPQHFFEREVDNPRASSTVFLHTPVIGLHSLLLRGVHPSWKLNSINDDVVDVLMHDAHLTNIDLQLRLYTLFPPPCALSFFSSLLEQHSLSQTFANTSPLLHSLVATTVPFGESCSFTRLFDLFVSHILSAQCRHITSLSPNTFLTLILHEIFRNNGVKLEAPTLGATT
ncbi:hypothetical protein BLNAU_17063 [Blattamonas nauphoetae]|uniref:Uncharacterized protein n=1 Tax=Blattamonas nauphoetae TaxID=2049346 RepID=A0ABQ9XBJ7_9EUKA|nr:hypothetical protein BLNAU_17063 [Blattamonas nauphoetae]